MFCESRDFTTCVASHADHGFKIDLVHDEQRRALHVDDLPALEIAQEAGDRLARRADHLRDLFVRKEYFEARSLRRRFAVIGAPVEQQARKFLRGRLGQTARTHLPLRGVIFLTELLCGMHAGFEMRIEDLEEIVALDEIQIYPLSRSDPLPV